VATNKPIKHLVVHCSATKPSQVVDITDIDRWHRQKGYLKVGYHYVILRDGEVQKGRPDTEVGAHVQGHNTGTLGICLVGGLNEKTGKSEANYTDEQYAALSGLLFKLQLEHPDADVKGHRDFPKVHKDCPCFNVSEWWETYQKEHQ
jgi:N-acetylmuramoyl-L-alanine amidase